MLVFVVFVFAVAPDDVPMMLFQILCGLAGIVTVRSVPLTVPTVLLVPRLKVGLEFTTIPVQFNVLLSTFTQIPPLVQVISVQVLSSAMLLQFCHLLSQMFETRIFDKAPFQACSQILMM